MNIKVTNVDINKCSTQILIEKNINTITNAVLPLANQIIEKGIKFTLPIFFKEIQISHKNQYIGINYMLRKELYFDVLNTIFNDVLRKLKTIILQEDKQKVIQSVREICEILNNCVSKYIINNDGLKNKLYDIIKTIKLLVEDCGLNINMYLPQLMHFILDINKYSDVEFLISLYSNIEYFFKNNREYTKIPNKESNLDVKLMKGQLSTTALGIVCRAQIIMKQLINEGKDFFIYYKQGYEECLESKSNIIYSL